jgi:hypothetical protein
MLTLVPRYRFANALPPVVTHIKGEAFRYNGSSPVQMNYTRGKSLTDGK